MKEIWIGSKQKLHIGVVVSFFSSKPANSDKWDSMVPYVDKASADNMAELLQSILDGTVHIDKINKALKDYHGE